jgi:hypothetical protein
VAPLRAPAALLAERASHRCRRPSGNAWTAGLCRRPSSTERRGCSQHAAVSSARRVAQPPPRTEAFRSLLGGAVSRRPRRQETEHPGLFRASGLQRSGRRPTPGGNEPDDQRRDTQHHADYPKCDSVLSPNWQLRSAARAKTGVVAERAARRPRQSGRDRPPHAPGRPRGCPDRVTTASQLRTLTANAKSVPLCSQAGWRRSRAAADIRRRSGGGFTAVLQAFESAWRSSGRPDQTVVDDVFDAG